MRKLLEKLFRQEDEPVMMDDVRPKRDKKQKDWRDAAIRKAAIKYGRAFKCGSASLDREVLVDSRWIVVKGGETPEHKAPLENVSAIIRVTGVKI